MVERADTDRSLRTELEAARDEIAALREKLAETTPDAVFRVLVQSSPDPILTLDRDGTVVFTNGVDPRWVVGAHVLDGVDAPFRDCYRQALALALKTGEPQSFELTTDGPTSWLTRVVPLRNADLVAQVLVVSTNITEANAAERLERRSLEVQMRHAQKLESLGVLAGGIAHDFNNILTGILGSASIAAMKVPSGSPASEHLARILKAAEKAAELTNQMLAYAGKGRFVMEAVDLNEVVEEVIPLVESSIAKKTKLLRSFAADLPTIEADKAQLQQVVMNLITNASEALGGGAGIVSVRTGALEKSAANGSPGSVTEVQVFLKVTDSGKGMAPETRAKIFEPFFTTKFTGRGLGLAAVQGIVRAHHGSIRVESEVQRGTTFTALFPATNRRKKKREEPVSTPLAIATGTILVVDDEESVRNVARAALEQAGFRVLVAEDGVAAVEVFRRHAPDIDAVLLDMSMPKMSGEETLLGLRGVRPEVPVVLTSGYGHHEISERVEVKDVAGFVQKPFRARDLVEMLLSAAPPARPR